MAEIYNFFGDIWDYLRETYFSVDFGKYHNFDLGNHSTTLAQMILGMMIGISLAAIVIVYERQHLGCVARALLKAEAQDEESAKTLAELGCEWMILVKRSLRRRDSALRKLIRYVGEPDEQDELPDEVTGKREKKRLVLTEMIDFSTTRFYIPPALRDRAAIRYEEKGSDWRALVLTVVVCIVGGGLLIRLLPVLLRVADNVLTWVNG